MIATIVISAIFAVLFFLAVRHVIKHGSCAECGKGGCSGSCGTCPYQEAENDSHR